MAKESVPKGTIYDLMQGAVGTHGVEPKVYAGDCVSFMQQLPANRIDLVFADPPFNVGYKYDVYDDKQTYENYLAWSRAWISEVYRILLPTGTFWLAAGDEVAAELKLIAQEVGFHTRSWVIWFYTFGVNSPKKMTRSHAHLFYFVRDPKKHTFNAKEIKVPSARQLVYNDKRAKDGGRLPDDTWILRPQWLPDAFCSGEDTWSVSRVCGTFKERQGTPNQMPERLLGRIIRLTSHANDYVYDPFAGSGTTLAVAKKLGRRYFGSELSADYARDANTRILAAQVGQELDGAAQQGD